MVIKITLHYPHKMTKILELLCIKSLATYKREIYIIHTKIMIILNTDGYFLPLGRVASPGCSPFTRFAILSI